MSREEALERAVASFPPLSSTQREQISVILSRPGSPSPDSSQADRPAA